MGIRKDSWLCGPERGSLPPRGPEELVFSFQQELGEPKQTQFLHSDLWQSNKGTGEWKGVPRVSRDFLRCHKAPRRATPASWLHPEHRRGGVGGIETNIRERPRERSNGDGRGNENQN